MAVLASAKSIERTLTASQPQKFLPPTAQNGLYKMVSQYVLLDADSVGVGGLIEMCVIPAGLRLVGAKVTTSAALGTATIDVGWAAGAKGVETAVADGIIDGLDVSSAVSQGGVLATEPGFMKVFAEDVVVYAKAIAALAASGDATITLELDFIQA